MAHAYWQQWDAADLRSWQGADWADHIHDDYIDYSPDDDYEEEDEEEEEEEEE